MAIPIYPNTKHPSERSPVQSETPFPFPNCYHWIDSKATVRIRRKTDPYDDSHAIKISSLQHVKLGRSFSGDYDRIYEWQQAKLHLVTEDSDGSDSGDPRSSSPAHIVLPAPSPPSESSSSLASGLSGSSGGVPPHRDAHSATSVSHDDGESELPRPHSPEGDTEPPLETLFRLDIFGLAHDDTAELIPLVDLWFELTDHLTADTIPSPLDFYKERDAIVKFVQSLSICWCSLTTHTQNHTGCAYPFASCPLALP